MRHEYPANEIYDSVTEPRVNALSRFGFTERQRQFLVTVMVHSGCFLERQYCAFTGTVPYALLYTIRPKAIRILAVMNLKRRPVYWVGRS